MEDVLEKPGAWTRISGFFSSPMRSEQASPMKDPGDWIAAAGLIVLVIAVFALPWLRIIVKIPYLEPTGEYGLFVSPWAWGLVFVMLVVLAGIWFVQTRGWLTIGAGAFCLIFNVIFFFGVWYKINAVIGDLLSLARHIPVIGYYFGPMIENLLRELGVDEFIKQGLDVSMRSGYWVFMVGGILVLTGGIVRLVNSIRSSRKARELE